MFFWSSLLLKARVFGVCNPIFSACCCRSVLSETFEMAFGVLFIDGMGFASIFSTRVFSMPFVSGAIMYAASEDSAASWIAFSASIHESMGILRSASNGGFNWAIRLSRIVVTACPAAVASSIIVLSMPKPSLKMLGGIGFSANPPPETCS